MKQSLIKKKKSRRKKENEKRQKNEMNELDEEGKICTEIMKKEKKTRGARNIRPTKHE